MSRFPRLAQRLFNAPLLLRPEKAEVLCAALLDHLGIAKFDRIDGTSLDASQLRLRAGDWGESNPKTPRDMYKVKDGIARISVDGTLVHKLGGVEPYSGMVGYDAIDRIRIDARDNKDVRAILFDADTPGGETTGCFECAKKIYADSARFGGKPVYWLSNEMTCSAGYALASACDRIAIPESGIAGSIGVWVMLVDFTRKLDADGISVTLRRAGDRKARGHPLEGWDQELLDKIDAWIEETRLMFATLVSMGRPGLSVSAILDQEGDWFAAGEAADRGLVDAIASPDEVFEVLRDQVART